MKNSKEIFRDLVSQITLKEDPEEIQSILYIVLEAILGLSRADIIAEKSISFSAEFQHKLKTIIRQINQHEPVQYILGETYFFGRRFNVSPAVLIPRPETELLVEEVLKEIQPFTPGTIVDIGTGSGCIAVTLAKELPDKKIVGIDVSEAALKIARGNTLQLNATAEFQHVNVLQEFPFQGLEMIVSNPPYIAFAEKESMKRNVLDHEPHLALFVSDNDPLQFYKAIAEKGYSALLQNGKILVEINERFGNEVADVFRESGFKSIRIIKDLQQKDRIVIAHKR
ncbi:MAG TPA: peptide chain release factor N(5)-glutamine methyltransferase [Cyclobacteriaceae bacterium]|nr:peptide chain release factor N(5)-glutamine methyltransferase [Cyclobacteriaceae bacterium]